MNLKKLFFYDTPDTKRKTVELEKPLNICGFHSVLVSEFNFCNDDRIDDGYLSMLYEQYVKMFYSNIGSFSDFFKNMMMENGVKNIRLDNIKPYMVFGDDVWKKTKSTTDFSYYRNRGYKIEFIEELLKNRQSLTSEESFKKRYGSEWKERFKEYVEKHKKSLNSNPDIENIRKKIKKNFTFEYYLDKINPDTKKLYTVSEAKELVSNRCKEASRKNSDKIRGSHGVTCRSVKFWMDKGFDEDYAKNKVKEIQSTNSVEKYIMKYGEQDGLSKWLLRNKEWGKKIQKKRMESGNIGCSYSRASKEFFDNLIIELTKNCIKFNNVYYGEHEFCKWDSDNNRPYFYDFVIPELKICIEYNGVKFHPKEGDETWRGLFGETYEYKLNYDKRKIKVIEDCGYTVVVVWEDDDLNMKTKEIVSLLS